MLFLHYSNCFLFYLLLQLRKWVLRKIVREVVLFSLIFNWIKKETSSLYFGCPSPNQLIHFKKVFFTYSQKEKANGKGLIIIGGEKNK